MSIYRNIQDLCAERKISVSALETELHFSRGSIYKWDTNTPSVEKVKKIAEFFNVPIEEVIRERATA